jgi:predicted PurR-regulated permease PerM
MATVGIFVLILVICLYFSRPISPADPGGATDRLHPCLIVKRARKHGIPPDTALFLVLMMMAVAGLAVTVLAGPVGEWIGRALRSPRQSSRSSMCSTGRWALRELQNTLMPAAGPAVAVEPSKNRHGHAGGGIHHAGVAQIVLFFATMGFVLAGQMEFRRYTASLFASRDAKLRFLRIANDIEGNLASYVAVVTVINIGLGILVTLGAWSFGFSNPIIFGVAAMLLNYIPYIGPACMALILLAVGLVTFPTLGHALLPPAAFVALTTLEGHIITPTVLGRSLTLNPLAVFLALAFWTWMWGPMGAFLSVPLLIVALVIFGHLFPSDDIKLPG